MKFKLVTKAAAFLAALSMASNLAAAPGPGITLLGFTMNPALIVSMVNIAQQHNGQITEYPAYMNPAVVQVTIRNDGPDPITPCFEIAIEEPGAAYSCPENTGPNSTIVTGGKLTTKLPIAPGQTKVLGAADFLASGSFNGTVNPCFRKDMENSFSDPNKMGENVAQMLKKKFQVCLVLVDCAGGPLGQQKCDNFTIFNQQPGVTSSVPVIIYPHNNAVDTDLINFVWAPAVHPSLPQSEISYRVEIMEGESSSEPIETINIPKGQTFLQYGAANRALKADVKHWWRVRGLDANGNPFGGRDGSGWNIVKWFLIRKGMEVSVSLQDLDTLARNYAQGKGGEVSAQLNALVASQLLLPTDLRAPLLKQLKSGKATVVGIEIKKK